MILLGKNRDHKSLLQKLNDSLLQVNYLCSRTTCQIYIQRRMRFPWQRNMRMQFDYKFQVEHSFGS